MFNEEDSNLINNLAGAIEGGLQQIANSQPDLGEMEEAIRYAGEKIERGLCLIAASLDRLSDALAEQRP